MHKAQLKKKVITKIIKKYYTFSYFFKSKINKICVYLFLNTMKMKMKDNTKPFNLRIRYR